MHCDFQSKDSEHDVNVPASAVGRVTQGVGMFLSICVDTKTRQHAKAVVCHPGRIQTDSMQGAELTRKHDGSRAQPVFPLRASPLFFAPLQAIANLTLECVQPCPGVEFAPQGAFLLACRDTLHELPCSW
jgi:hypothetical protein